MTENVKIKFEADVTIRAGGIVSVPKDIWENREDGDAWGEKAEEFVKEHIDFTHLDGGFDREEVEIFDLSLATPAAGERG